MSKILRRPMFRGGGKVSSYGNGIATGLADGGRVGLEIGGIPAWAQNADARGYKTGTNLLKDNVQSFSRADIMNFIQNNPASLNSNLFNKEGMVEDEDGNLVMQDSRMGDPKMRPLEENEIDSPAERFQGGFDTKASASGIMKAPGVGDKIYQNQTEFEKVYRDMITSPMDFDFSQSAAEAEENKKINETTDIATIINESMIPNSSTVENSVKEAGEKPGELITISNSSDEDASVVNESDLSSIIDNYEQLLLKGTSERNEKRLKKARITDASNFGLDLFAKSTKEGATVRSMFGEAAENLASKPSKTEKLLDKQDDNEDKIKQAAAMLGIKGEQAQKLYETKLKNKDSSGQTEKAVRYISSITGKDAKDALKDYLREDTSFAETVGKYKKSEGALTAQGFGLAAEDFYEGLYIDDIPTDGNVKKGDTAPGKENGIYTDNKNLILFEIKDEVIISSRNYS